MKPLAKLSIATVLLVYSSGALAQSSDDVGDKVYSLKWAVGPKTLSTVGNADIYLPAKFGFLDSGETKKLNELLQNPGDDKIVNTFAPEDLAWTAYLSFEDLGYVKDDENIDADAILVAIREGTEQSNKIRKERGWEPLIVVGWRYPPHYDNFTKRLVWAIEGRSGSEPVINYTEKLLGRQGVTTAVLVSGPEKIDQQVKEFEAIIDGYHFRPGDSYEEFKSGDKVAEIGLTALILGGGVAAVAKSGIGKGLFKIIGFAAIAAFAAIVGGIKRLFRAK